MCESQSVRITYHNAFHQGAQTSFMEMILKVPEAVTGDRVILKQMWVFQSLRFSRLID